MTDPTPSRASRLGIATAEDPSVLVLTGEIDPHTASRLADIVDETVAATDGQVVLDLGAVSFVDSSGLRVFANAQRELASQGRSLVLRSVNESLHGLLEVTGLSDHLVIET